MAIDWVAVNNEVSQIRPKVKETLDFVIEEASNADEKIGTEIAEYIAANVPHSLEILAAVAKEIEAKTLTVDGAKAHVEKLKANQQKTREHLKPTVEKLPEAVRAKIRARLDENMTVVVALATKTYALLGQ